LALPDAQQSTTTTPNAWIGVYDVNPLRQDIEEIGALIKVDLALNAVLTQHKQIAAAFFGHPLDVIRKGIPVVQQICGSPCIQKFDIVVASAGGHPKDINFYQAQKALTHASLFCKPGGSLILAAACPEGTGNRAYEEFMRGLSSADEVMARFRQQEFRVGPHKAFQVARLLNDFTLYLVSDISPDLVSRLLMRPSASVQAALDECLNTSSHKSVAVLPHATTTIALR
jgi:nickel-dependent lactate racemase